MVDQRWARRTFRAGGVKCQDMQQISVEWYGRIRAAQAVLPAPLLLGLTTAKGWLMADSISRLDTWHCPGSERVGSNRLFNTAICVGCGKRRAQRNDGLIPKHPKPGMYHPNKQPKPKRDYRAEVERVEQLAAKWESATELSSGQPSIVARAFAAEIRNAIAGGDA